MVNANKENGSVTFDGKNSMLCETYNNTGEEYMVTRKSFLNNIKFIDGYSVAGLPWLKNISQKIW
jgi:hypothetical protein